MEYGALHTLSFLPNLLIFVKSFPLGKQQQLLFRIGQLISSVNNNNNYNSNNNNDYNYNNKKKKMISKVDYSSMMPTVLFA